MKKGFGLMEVLVAAVVLGFLIVGLTRLQVGNREAILRVRARDAANFVAQHVLDSIAAVGIKTFKKGCEPPPLYQNDNYSYSFEGNAGEIKTKNDYKVEVRCIDDEEDTDGEMVGKTVRTAKDNSSLFTRGANYAGDTISLSLEAVVSWQHRDSWQSIKMARVVR